MFDSCLYFNTTALARSLERQWTTAFKPFGLTPSQAFMLRVVLARPALLQSELAKELVISRPTATRTLDGLQTLGLVERRTRQSDGREYAIHPTVAALQIREGLDAASAAVTKRLKEELGQSHFEGTVTNLRSIRTRLE
jgi:DNA-binding MarR family transcriptional regulator